MKKKSEKGTPVIKGTPTKKARKAKVINSDFEKLGARMRELRIKKGYKTSEIFAYEKELPRAQYGQYEAGVQNLTYKNLLKVLAALEISVEEFFSKGFEDSPKKD